MFEIFHDWGKKKTKQTKNPLSFKVLLEIKQEEKKKKTSILT